MSDFKKTIEAFRSQGLNAPRHIAKVLLGRWRAHRTARAIATASDIGTKFSLIYKEKWWDKDGESVSGPGSTLDFTRSFRSDLENFIREREVASLLDAPCGDFNWFRQVEVPAGFHYIGGDIVPDLIAGLQQRYGSDSRRFTVLDIAKDDLPEVDIWLCRDCLIHLSNATVWNALERFAASRIPHALISNYIGQGPNADIASGDFRPLDLTQAPFFLPPPELRINDWPGDEGIRYVGLWSREAIAGVLHHRAGKVATAG